MNQLTSQQILTNPDDLHDKIPFQYTMTDGEIAWYNHTYGKYCVPDWINEAGDGEFTLTINDDSIETMSEALDDDQMPPKAVMLSDDSALQHIFFYLYNGDN